MFRLLKKILLGLLLLIGILLIVAWFLPTEIEVTRTTTIARNQSEVFSYIRLLENQPKYGVWWKADPNMKITNSGTDGQVGFVHGWNSKDDNVGEGQQKIIKISTDSLESRMDMELKFIRPFESTNPCYMQTKQKASNKTEVAWSITSKMPYPFNLMGAVMNMEDMLGSDLEKGLKNLKVLLEKEDY